MWFWVAAASVTGLSLLVVLMPLLRRGVRAERRASYDMQIYRDQLREIEADVARGVLTEAEAHPTRAEVSRRLLAAADAEAAEAAAAQAPAAVSRIAAVAVLAVAVALTGWLYGRIGVPGMADLPLATRMAQMAELRANRPGQAEVEAILAVTPEEDLPPRPAPPPVRPEDVAMVERLAQAMTERPDDLRGHRLLAGSMATLGRWPEARAAQERVVALLGAEATADDYVAWAEFMILAVNGYVSPEAESALSRVLTLDPANPLGRYYSGLASLQGGRADLTWRLWNGLLEEGPPDAPWVAAIEAEIDEVARMAGMPPRGAAQMPGPTAEPTAGPTAAEVEAAQTMTPEERQAMIEGMVAAARRAAGREGGPAEDWARLIRALGVLGRTGEASTIWREARGAFEGDAAALDALRAAARDAGVAN
jgi:cytochrome c-type biogenesis protein CcmH